MGREGLRSEWDARPPTMRLFVVASVAGAAVATIRDPNAYGFPAILFTLFLVALLWKLWAGDRAVWWLFVIVATGALVAGLTAAFDEPAAWASVAATAFSLMLLLARPTRAWIEQRSGSA